MKTKRLKILEFNINDNKLTLEKIQLEGKKPVTFEEFKRGYPQSEFDFS